MLVTIANFTEPYEAHLLRGRLEAEGIVAFVAHEQHIYNNYPLGLALGGAKVQVHRDLAREARAIERRCIAGEYRLELDARFGQAEEICPHCGAADFKTRAPAMYAAILVASWLTFGIIFPLSPTIRTCRSCGTRWDRNLAP